MAQSRLLDDEFKSRVKRLRFTITPFEAWVFVETLKALPEDTVILTVGMDFNAMCWNMFCASEKFEVVEEGAFVPEIAVTIDAVTRTVELKMPVGPENFMSALGEL